MLIFPTKATQALIRHPWRFQDFGKLSHAADLSCSLRHGALWITLEIPSCQNKAIINGFDETVPEDI